MSAPVAYLHGSQTLEQWTKSTSLRDWVRQQYELCKPEHLYLCTGSAEENLSLKSQMVLTGQLVRLNESNWPGCFLARSPPADVARVESRTFICSEKEADAGPTNNWSEPQAMKSKLRGLFDGCMRGRTMYAVPYCMGPVNSPYSAVGVELTDSAYVVINAYVMTRMGRGALRRLGTDGFFVPCMHSTGAPIAVGVDDAPWPQNSDKYICHFPESKEIWSYGSGYGGNALCFKKSYALRIASVLAREQGWLAEHMLIMGVTNPKGEKKYVTGAFPSACGKTNFAMLTPSVPGWEVETVGDDIAWLRWHKDGKLHAINPEAGFFGVAPGTSAKTNPNALAAAHANTIFTNVAVDLEGNPWWEGLTKSPPAAMITWLGHTWEADSPQECAHANSRFTAPAAQCPSIDPNWEAPEGVPIDAIIFGGRRSDTVPLVYQALDWAHGVYMGATLMSEVTAAAADVRDRIRNDPFAMRPFIGYHVGDYLQHWLDVGAAAGEAGGREAPKVFMVNWFRRDENGRFLWPGFGDNVRVLEWILDRCRPDGGALPTLETPIGHIPHVAKGGLNTDGLRGVDAGGLEALFRVDVGAWLQECKRNEETLHSFGERLPPALLAVHGRLVSRLTGGTTTAKLGV